MKLYIETSVINFVFATDDIVRANLTKDFFESATLNHELIISELVLEEIEKAKSPKKEKMTDFIFKHKFRILKQTEAVEKLASKYVEEKIIPEKYLNDALHIALAVINNLDVIVSWNLEHIVKLKTITCVNKINKGEGLPSIYINTPEEVLE